jgi:peptide/nickel transport system ATP-binding protein
MLKLNQLSKTYRVGTFGGKELRAVNNVNIDINDRELVSLIGESGSGKSTIGKMILRLISITSGSILLDGRNINSYKGNSIREYYRKVQGVFQDPFSSFNPIFKADQMFKTIHDEFYPHVTGREWTTKLENSLKDVGLNPEHVLNKYPHQLSGGQLQRFLIARALLLDIKFLVADEIISMLDASTRVDILNLLADLRMRGLSILFITHDLSLGYYISDKSVILYCGCVVEKGSTEKIYKNPLHPYTEMLMASVPRLDKKWDSTEISFHDEILGQTGGCAFYNRCNLLGRDKNCACNQPTLREVAPDHFVACDKV